MVLASASVSALPVASGASPAPARFVLSNGPRSTAAVALTFDDGSSPANCRRILAILLDKGVMATFFPAGKKMELDPAFWRLVAKAGYPIGNHSMTHPDMRLLSADAQFRQIDRERALEETITGAPLLRVFRPPYGAYNATTVAAAGRAGYPVVLLWDVSSRDTSPRGSVKKMLSVAETARNGSVILMHCGPNATPYLLGPLIDSLRGRGLSLVTVPALLGLDWHPGPVTIPTRAEILGALSPLPATSAGGSIIGGTGVGAPSPDPSTAPTPALATPQGSTGASAPATPASPDTTAAASVARTASPPALPKPSTGGIEDLAALAALVGFAAAALAGLVAIARRRRPSG
jgi:peptidoglycan/xylan/chitin deacetylase (PgdA/CDA1 family)